MFKAGIGYFCGNGGRGPYGSNWGVNSIKNPNGRYGAEWSSQSPNNQHTITPPVIRIEGYLE